MKLDTSQKAQIVLFFLLGEAITLLIVTVAITGYTLSTCSGDKCYVKECLDFSSKCDSEIVDCCVYEIAEIFFRDKLMRELNLFFVITPLSLGLLAGVLLAQRKYSQFTAQKILVNFKRKKERQKMLFDASEEKGVRSQKESADKPLLHTIEILGVKLSEEHFPALYQWAKKSPDMVRESVQGMMDKQGFETPEGAMIILESDMSHL